MRAVEPNTPALVASLQGHGIRIMGLTARPLSLATATQQQLASVAIDLAKTPVAKENLSLTGVAPSLFTQGILYVGPCSGLTILQSP